jgi:hypothetical protein
VSFNALPADAKASLDAAAKSAGASLVELSGTTVLTIRAAELK